MSSAEPRVIVAAESRSRLAAALGGEWSYALPRLAAVFLGSRLMAVVAAFLGELANSTRPAWQLTTDTPIVRSLTSWDGVYYVSIAANGYSTQPHLHDRPFYDYVFFPGLPALMRLVHDLSGLDYAVAGLVIGNVCSGLALVALYSLARRRLDRRVAVIAAAFVAFAPGATGFAMSYGDGLYLLAAAVAFLALESRRDWLAAAAFALATLTRLPGIMLGLPLLILLIEADGRRPTRRWLILAAGPVALAAFYAYLWSLTGDPLANIHGQAAWSQQTLPPLAPVLVVGLGLLIVAMVAVLTASAAMLYRSWKTRNLGPAYATYAGLGLAIVVGTLRVVSLPRYIAVLFPLSWGFATHPRWRALLVASAILYFVFSFAAFGPGLAP